MQHQAISAPGGHNSVMYGRSNTITAETPKPAPAKGKVERKCKWCKKPFQARAADVKRGWAKFCSKSCKAKEQEKRTGQYRALGARDADADHERAMDDSTGGWDEGGWRGDESGCVAA